MKRRSILFASILLLLVAVVAVKGSKVASGPFTDLSHVQVDHAEEPTCGINDFKEPVAEAVNAIKDFEYFQIWRNELHNAAWDPVPYIVEQIPEAGTCHGIMFAIQKALYHDPSLSPEAAVKAANPQDIITFDVMRLAYTELFYWIAMSEMNAGPGLPSNVDRATLRQSFQASVDKMLGNGHFVQSINECIDLNQRFDEMVVFLVAELTSLSNPTDQMTAYVNVLGGKGPPGKKEVVGAMMMRASAPNFVLFDTYAPGYIAGNETPTDLEGLVKQVLTYIKTTYFADPTLAGQGMLQLQVYHKNQ